MGGFDAFASAADAAGFFGVDGSAADGPAGDFVGGGAARDFADGCGVGSAGRGFDDAEVAGADRGASAGEGDDAALDEGCGGDEASA